MCWVSVARGIAGSPRIARVVMAAAAKHLTPVALELGGKCPCIFDTIGGSARDLQTAVNRVVGGKWSSCAGQACLAIDYVLVEERFVPVLVRFHLTSRLLCFATRVAFVPDVCVSVSRRARVGLVRRSRRSSRR
jgi:acyl-CoA reductase-like NAD-dependent aldehyde dehydrogenase